jgi:endonuclease/exonuclease/phosphatase family metal-dependent hydrolase
MISLRVVSLNLWGDRQPLARRLALAAEELRALAPDVVFLQEVRVGDNLPSTADDLAARVGPDWKVTYRCATRGDAGTWGATSTAGEEGLAILSPHVAGQVAVVELPEARATERRILLSAHLDVGGASVWCHTTHLHWRLGDGIAREKQVLAIDAAVRALSADGPHILAGDFNAAPDTDEIRFLTGKHTLGGRRTHWQDAYAVASPSTTGWTWARRNSATEWLAWLDRDRRIDYVFVSTERPDGRARVLDARVVLDRPSEDGTFASDHFAVLAEVQV